MFTTADMVYDQIWQHPTEPFAMMDRRWKQSIEIAPNCPRCASANTKFCYYNNYSLSQPRYFCKGCRRYWTKGGSLRNALTGGGCCKSRRGRSGMHGQSQRNSGMDGFHSNSSRVPNREALLAEEGHETTEIDLAAVFAKFLDQSPSSVEEFDSEPPGSSSNFSNSLTPESVENEISNVTMLDQKQPDPKLPMGYNFPGQEFRPSEKIDDFGESDDCLYAIDRQLLDLVGGNDQLFQDDLWSESDTAAAACGGFILQPLAMQMSIPTVQQEMEYSLQMNHEDDYQSHVHSTTSMLNDHWGSIDLSSFEIFSRPIN